MYLSKHGRRLVAAATIAASAIMLPAVALAASGGPAAQPAAIGTCRTVQLTDWLGVPGNQTAGSSFYQLEISNISHQACTLYGFPGVSAWRAGKRLGSPAARSYGDPENLLTLAPHSTVHVILQVVDVGVYSPASCHYEQAFALKVYAPGDYGWHLVPLTFEACAKHGPIFLRVTPAQHGTGIPGYSH
ncbi:MAG TPA: DUF4232 domain-containing protein [Streptosporangiaceae bacterium]|nr:DUF4232 domain-containing protein [Streptosporangiaceae bacterium]